MRRLHDAPTTPPLVLEFDRTDAEMLIDQINVLVGYQPNPEMHLPSGKYPHLSDLFDELSNYLDEVEGG